jgi:hypothetical protein
MGTAGLPPQRAPLHGRGDVGRESDEDGRVPSDARSVFASDTNDGRIQRSWREVTRWEQLACTSAGTQSNPTRSMQTAPASALPDCRRRTGPIIVPPDLALVSDVHPSLDSPGRDRRRGEPRAIDPCIPTGARARPRRTPSRSSDSERQHSIMGRTRSSRELSDLIYATSRAFSSGACSGQNRRDDLAVDVGQSHVAAAEAIGEPLVVHA